MIRNAWICAIPMLAAGVLMAQENRPPARAAEVLRAPGPAGLRVAQPAQPRLLNPASPAARLMLATPEQRQRALEQLPPERQEQVRQQLQWFDSLPKAQQAIEIRRIERFAALPPDQRAAVRGAMQALNQLPPARRQAIRRALVALGALNANQRARRMNNPAFRARFTAGEQRIIAILSDGLLPPL
jgi:hypothetical protein